MSEPPFNDLPTYVSERPPSGLRMDDFDYQLDEARIAQTPIEPRDSARLLVATDPAGAVSHRIVRDLPEILQSGDLLVVNETRVIPARLRLQKPTGGSVEVFLVDRHDGDTWKALVRPSRRVAVGSIFTPGPGLAVEVFGETDGGQRFVRLLDDDGAVLNDVALEAQLSRYGIAPLPPYITSTITNPERYQTVFSAKPGSSAAPTAGLHLTPEVIRSLMDRGIGMCTVNLTVGLDTFRPVTVEQPEDHEIHSERYEVPQETLDACAATKAAGGRVVAVGTTSVRALESAAAFGANTGRTKLFIYGNYRFQVVDLLLTNFHLPRSSLLLLVQAFAGPRWRDIYQLAQHEQYRFLSFGDAMLLGPGSVQSVGA
jgi:S-adenosylmethionine:tRNA ribosyltransferase-isomerase